MGMVAERPRGYLAPLKADTVQPCECLWLRSAATPRLPPPSSPCRALLPPQHFSADHLLGANASHLFISTWITVRDARIGTNSSFEPALKVSSSV